MKKFIHLAKLILFAFLIIQINSIDITLSSTMSNKEESTYIIENNVLTLNSNSEYTISGSCNECQIEVAKGISPTITLNSITIDNSQTGPFVIKKGSTVKLILSGESTIIDNEKDEDSSDFEGAGLKIKSSSSLTISGDGKLNIIGTIKNGIKGGSGSNLIINGGILNITAVNNALAADNSVTINDGTFIIKTSEGDGIKSDPDYGDNDSEGIITINGGTFNINSYSDGIQAKSKLIIKDGNFNIKTYNNGASSTNFNKDEESAKGLKCSWNETNITKLLNIEGGNFILDTADDSIHSDGNITIIGGKFTISSGDDAVHADQNLILGKKDGDNNMITMNIVKSYEGLEGAQVYIYSGTYNIISSDDGINAAGDTNEECNGFPQGGNNQPNDNRSWGNNPRQNNLKRNLKNRKLNDCLSFHIYIYGGEIYVNAEADGFDANGNIIISGGNITVWGAKSGSDGDPIDMDGSLTISGGTLLAGGNQGMTQIDRQASNLQYYITSKTSYSTNQVIYIVNDDTTIREIKIPKNIQSLYYTSSEVDSSYKFSTNSVSNSASSSDENSSSSDSSSSDESSSSSDEKSSSIDSSFSDSKSSSSDDNSSSSDENFTLFVFSFHLKINLLALFGLILFIY